MSLTRFLKDLRYRLFYRLFTRTGLPLVTLGSECKWTIDDRSLNATSRVLCGGAGHDISFEKALITKYGCRVVLLDPSPTGIATVQRENPSAESLMFLPVGLAAVDGVVNFQEPADVREGSFVGKTTSDSGGPKFTCKTLSTIMAELDWPDIDLLKIDIEGFEFAVLRDVLEKGTNIRQICVELHHGPSFGRSRAETAKIILALRKAGYILIHHVYWDHTFLRREC